MIAVGYTRSLPISDPQSLADVTVADPVPGAHDVLVRVRAVAVNPVDTKQRRRAAPPPGAVKILGWDAAGTVEAVGADVTLFAPGDDIFYAGAIDRQGANSELHVVDERIVGHKPATLSFAQAAALPLTSITAWELLFDRLGVAYGRKRPGGTLLVINGAGGVGSMLVQLARRLTGLTVVATASRSETIAWCHELGAHAVVDHRRPLDEALHDAGFRDVEYVASLSATDRHLPAIVKAIAPQGKMAVIDDPPTLDVMPFKTKCVSVHWEAMFARSLFHTGDMIAQHDLLEEISALVDEGVLRTTLKTELGTMNAANLRRAHEIIESGTAIGKIVLSSD